MNATPASRLGWYARRVARMSPAEVAWRTRDQVLQAAWSRRQVTPDQLDKALLAAGRRPQIHRRLAAGTAARVSEEAKAAVLASADRLLRGEWEVLGVVRNDLVRPDWFRDPVTGRRSSPDRYAFRVDHRSEEQVGNVKQVWEISRLQHLTLLATAWFLSHEDKYATRVADHLRSWWQENPFLSGVHWTSGIELGVRLISLAWIRRLLDDWPGIADLFERDALALRQIHWHQQYLAAFPSRGSSANNHVIAEAAGQLVASCAFPWFPESERWRRKSARLLERELIRNTFPSGHRPRACLGLPVLRRRTRASRGRRGRGKRPPARAPSPGNGCARWRTARRPWSMSACARLARVIPTKVARCCSTLRRLTAGHRCWRSPMRWSAGSTGGRGRPRTRAARLSARWLAPSTRSRAGPARRPSRFADAGTTLLRTTGENEIWCRCDGGPHGYLSIAAHAHADALSVEVRYAGVDILADPGTYCYHGERAWRSYFRSTIAHNTAELGGRSQSSEGGPFMWVRHARAREVEVIDDGDIARWTAEHDGYASLDPPALHRRSVLLDRASRSIDIIDEIEGGSHDIRLAFHLGPDVQVELRRIVRSPGLACRIRARSGTAGTALRAPVEPAPG